MENNWVEVDGDAISASESRSLWVLRDRDLDTTTGSNGTLVFTVDTQRFFVYDKHHVPYQRRPTRLQRLRRFLWHA